MKIKKINLIQFGLGNIGSTLIKEVIKKHSEKFNYVGVFDSTRFYFNLKGIKKDKIINILDYKKEKIVKPTYFIRRPKNVFDIFDSIAGSRTPCILIDVTNSKRTYELIKYALSKKIFVVTANKEPMVVSIEKYKDLMKLQKDAKTKIGYEATIGAGLAIVSQLKSLQNSGDEIVEIEGCFSGTLDYVLSEMQEKNKAFSKAVSDARVFGYTEPDPREDLTGRDMARKGLILGRTIGLDFNLNDVKVESLIPEELTNSEKVSMEEFWNRLNEANKSMKKKVENAGSNGNILKYTTRINRDEGIIITGLKEFNPDSQIGRSERNERIIVIKTRKYYEKPFILAGLGAGPIATVRRIMNDLFYMIFM